MKTKKLISKVNRYLVLSKEFEQDVDILFEDRALQVILQPKLRQEQKLF